MAESKSKGLRTKGADSVTLHVSPQAWKTEGRRAAGAKSKAQEI